MSNKKKNNKSKRNNCPDCNGVLKEHSGSLICMNCESVFSNHKEVKSFHKFRSRTEKQLHLVTEQ